MLEVFELHRLARVSIKDIVTPFPHGLPQLDELALDNVCSSFGACCLKDFQGEVVPERLLLGCVSAHPLGGLAGVCLVPLLGRHSAAHSQGW